VLAVTSRAGFHVVSARYEYGVSFTQSYLRVISPSFVSVAKFPALLGEILGVNNEISPTRLRLRNIYNLGQKPAWNKGLFSPYISLLPPIQYCFTLESCRHNNTGTGTTLNVG
jgi:hypothetical protein